MMVLAFIEVRMLVQRCHDFKNSLSTETLVAGIAKKSRTIAEMTGNRRLLHPQSLPNMHRRHPSKVTTMKINETTAFISTVLAEQDIKPSIEGLPVIVVLKSDHSVQLIAGSSFRTESGKRAVTLTLRVSKVISSRSVLSFGLFPDGIFD